MSSDRKQLKVAWFSAGVSSAVATKLVIGELDKIIYIHVKDQHRDTLRFVRDCAHWFGRPIEQMQSRYKSVDAAVRANGRYVNGPAGASCTSILKRRVRKAWERQFKFENVDLVYYWGMDAEEKDRADRLDFTMPDQQHRFPLIEQELTKQRAHEILRAAHIKRPKMYELGYQNNNCIGCIKGGMGYWNKIRVDFPKVFQLRAKMERDIGGTCINGVWLDELDPERGRVGIPICDECGASCETQA